MTRHEARIRARNRRKRILRRRALLALLFAGVLFAPNMIDAVYEPPPPVPLEYQAIPHPADSVARPPMPLRRGHSGLSVYELIDLRKTPSWRHDRQLDSMRLLRLLGDTDHVIGLANGVAVRDRSGPMGRIFDGYGPEVERLDPFDDSDFAPDQDRVEQLILGPPDPYVQAAMLGLSPVPQPRAVWLTLLGLLGLALAGRRRASRP